MAVSGDGGEGYGERGANNTVVEMPESPGQQIIVLSHVLLHKINYGYQNLTNYQVYLIPPSHSLLYGY